MLTRLAIASVIALIVPAAAVQAATGTLYATQITSTGGFVWMNKHLWVADHLQGLCRLDLQPNGQFLINPNTCNTTAVSPGQPVLDPSGKFVYVPDNSIKSQGIWRLSFDPGTETVSTPVLLAPTAGLGLNKPSSAAFGFDGKLYVGFIKSGQIVRLTNPAGASQAVENVGSSSDLRGVNAIAFTKTDLWVAEGGAVTRILAPQNCSGACVAQPTPVKALAPTALAIDRNNGDLVYVADTDAGGNSTIIRYRISTNVQDIYAHLGVQPNGTSVPFQFVTGLALDPNLNLFIGDDPSGGAQVLQGRAWRIPNGAAPEPPGLPPALTTGALYARQITSPAGVLAMGTHVWVSDHVQGFCRLDAQLDGTFLINPNTCNGAAASPGQAAFDAATNFVYVPDNSANSIGVWRLAFDPATETVGSATLLAPGLGLGGLRTTAAALGADGNLYVGSIRTGDIKRVVNPAAASQTVQTVGRTSDGGGASALTVVGPDLYLAQAGAITRIANVQACAAGCAAQATGVQATAPTALASDGLDVLYVANTNVFGQSTVLRYRISTGVQDVYANKGVFPDGTSAPFTFATALGLDSGGNLFVGDDPTNGAQVVQGHIWRVAPPI